MDLPAPEYLSLFEALRRIARKVKKPVYHHAAVRPLYDALCVGKFAGIADIVDKDDRLEFCDRPINPDDWKREPFDDFAVSVTQQRNKILTLRPHSLAAMVLYAANVRIATAELDDWLCPSAKPDQGGFGIRPRRGPKSEVLRRVISQMKADIESGKMSADGLSDKREKELETLYGASRDTVRKARNEVLNRNKKRANSDK